MDEMGIETGVDIERAIEIAKRAVDLAGHTTDSYILRVGKSKDLIRELPTGQLKNQIGKRRP